MPDLLLVYCCFCLYVTTHSSFYHVYYMYLSLVVLHLTVQ